MENDQLKMEQHNAIVDFVNVFAPPGHELRWSLGGGLSFDIHWMGYGWSQNITLEYHSPKRQVFFTWGSTVRSVANALALLSVAEDVVRFGARLETFLATARFDKGAT